MKMMKLLTTFILSLSISLIALAKKDCDSCTKIQELSKAHQSIKKENSDALADSVDKALAYAMEFKFSGNVQQREKEIEDLAALLVALNKDDVTGTAADLLHFYSEAHDNGAVRKGFKKYFLGLSKEEQERVKKDIDHSRKVKAKGNN